MQTGSVCPPIDDSMFATSCGAAAARRSGDRRNSPAKGAVIARRYATSPLVTSSEMIDPAQSVPS